MVRRAPDTARLLQCCLDESGVDGNLSPVAAMAGIVLEYDQFTWFDVAWKKALDRHGIRSAIHMSDFAADGIWANFPIPSRIALFTGLVAVINEHKNYSIAAIVRTEDYRQHFGKPSKANSMTSIYSMCFMLLALFQGKQAEHDNCEPNFPYFLDDGNERKEESFSGQSLRSSCACRSFGDDKAACALQAADVVAWAVRRRHSGLAFDFGRGPLEAVLGGTHRELTVQDDWLADVAEGRRAMAV